MFARFLKLNSLYQQKKCLIFNTQRRNRKHFLVKLKGEEKRKKIVTEKQKNKVSKYEFNTNEQMVYKVDITGIQTR